VTDDKRPEWASFSVGAATAVVAESAAEAGADEGAEEGADSMRQF
jgi:hypothetical protein